MPAISVKQWFGAKFFELHPYIQSLHLHGGQLAGPVHIQLGTGLGKYIGLALARKLSVPTTATPHSIAVHISHAIDGLHWDRCFDGTTQMKSLFVPVGTINEGYWIENTGPIRLAITVEIIDGGWYWRCLKIWVHGLRMPRFLFPNSTAFKRIEDGRYRFYVGFSLPIVGTVLSYSGLLNMVVTDKIVSD